MSIRRGMMAQMASGNVWKYTKYVTNVTEFESFDVFAGFRTKYITPHVTGLEKYFAIVNVLNNSSANRAAKFHIEYVDTSGESNVMAEIGQRIGGQFSGPYGGDIYAGATIEVFISTDIELVSM